MKIRYKLMLIIASLTIATLGLYIAACSSLVQEELSRMTLQTMSDSIRASAEKLSASLGQMTHHIATLANNTQLRNGLSHYEQQPLIEKWENWSKIHTLFQNWIDYSPYSQIHMHFISPHLFFRNAPFSQSDPADIVSLPAYRSSYGLQYWKVNADEGLCYCFMPVIVDMQLVGYVELALDISWFFQSSAHAASGLVTSLVTNDDPLLSNAASTDQVISYLSSPEASLRTASPLRLYCPVASTPFSVLGEMKHDVLTQSGNRMAQQLISIGIWILLLSLCMALLLSRAFSKKLTRLTSEIHRIRDGSFDVPPVSPRGDELNQALSDFSQMAQQLRKMMEDVRLAEQRQKESELQLLQAQINPHFISNALSLVDSLAQRQKLDQAHLLIMHISSYLRLSLHKSWQAAPLERELTLIETYWQIQQARFGNQLTLSLSIAPQLLAAQIPPLLLQPLVENAIIHGFARETQAGKLEIRIHAVDDTLVIEVEDNGKGMTASQLAELRHTLEHDANQSHYGLWNVHKRITTRYGSLYGLSIESIPHQGTLCILTLPLLFESL